MDKEEEEEEDDEDEEERKKNRSLLLRRADIQSNHRDERLFPTLNTIGIVTIAYR